MQKSEVLKRVSPRNEALVTELIETGSVACNYHQAYTWRLGSAHRVGCWNCRRAARRVISAVRGQLK